MKWTLALQRLHEQYVFVPTNIWNKGVFMNPADILTNDEKMVKSVDGQMDKVITVGLLINMWLKSHLRTFNNSTIQMCLYNYVHECKNNIPHEESISPKR